MTNTRELVVRAQKGNVEAQGELLDKVEESVLHLVRRRMGRRLRAREQSIDVVQSVLADALKGLEGFNYRGDGALMKWLTRMVENKLRKRARAMKYGDRNPGRVRAIDPGNSDVPGVDPPAEQPGAQTILGREEEMERLRLAMAQLSDRERRLIELRSIRRLSWDEVAQESGEATKKAAQRAHDRARVHLASLMGRSQESG